MDTSTFPQATVGPLHGLRIVEFAGIGPGPFAGMMLADMGADVIVVDRAADQEKAAKYPRAAMNRGKRSVALDLKSEAGRAAAWDLIQSADALIEGFRPGVMESNWATDILLYVFVASPESSRVHCTSAMRFSIAKMASARASAFFSPACASILAR